MNQYNNFEDVVFIVFLIVAGCFMLASILDSREKKDKHDRN